MKLFENLRLELYKSAYDQGRFDESMNRLKNKDTEQNLIAVYEDKIERLENELGFWENGMNIKCLEDKLEYWRSSYLNIICKDKEGEELMKI